MVIIPSVNGQEETKQLLRSVIHTLAPNGVGQVSGQEHPTSDVPAPVVAAPPPSAPAAAAAADAAAVPPRQRMPAVALRRDTTAISEFDHNDYIFACAMPHLFPLFQPQSVDDAADGASTSPALVKALSNPAGVDMLCWRHGCDYARDSMWAFLVYDQRQRHFVARRVARARTDKKSMKVLRELLSDVPGTIKQLEFAIAHPESKEALVWTNRVTAALVSTTAGLSFSPATRRMALQRMQSLCYWGGPPLGFVTVSPADMDLRLTQIMAGTMERPEDELPELHVRSKTVLENPAAAAATFGHMMHTILEDLIGVRAVSTSFRKTTGADADGAAATNYTQGILGFCPAQFGVVEAQGRGSLHFHCLIWSGHDLRMLTRAIHHRDEEALAWIKPKFTNHKPPLAEGEKQVQRPTALMPDPRALKLHREVARRAIAGAPFLHRHVQGQRQGATDVSFWTSSSDYRGNNRRLAEAD
jgi:hypothetical protein